VEFEKLFSGASGNTNTDGGTFQRMYGTWLTWTQSRKEDVFVVATTNGVDRLPPPALRKGRVDEIFFVDLPNEAERKTIFEIHLKRRGWEAEEYNIDTIKLARETTNRTGSEIEQIIVQGLINKVKNKGFGKEHPLETEDISSAISSIRTMFELNPNESEDIRRWATEHNVMFANDHVTTKVAINKNKLTTPTSVGRKAITINEGEI